MFKKIRKRDGNVVEFDSSKITAAIAKAGKATDEFGEVVAKKLTMRVLDLAHELSLGPLPDVEGVQDIVERVLFDTAFFKSAKAYILYREQHAQIRAIAAKASVNLVDSYLKRLDWKISENSNMSYSLQGLNNYISSDITSKYWLNRIYPPEIREAHENGKIHIHDLNLLSVYCVGWDLKDLLVQGFRGVEGKVESAPPKHLRSALGQIVNFFYTLQGEAAGAQAFSNFDTLLSPFIRFDNLKYGQVKQALQEFVFNINIPTRVGFQTPFTNITMDLSPPDVLKDQPVIIGGIEQESTYSDFQTEMDMLNGAFSEVMLEGDAKGMGVMAERIDAYSKTTESTIGKVWKDSAFQLYPGLIDNDQTEISNLVEFIRSHPESHERFDQIFREISMPDTGSFELKIIINRNGEDICSIPVGDNTFFTKINDLMPGSYDVKLNTGRILWQGELTDRDLLWAAAFPETNMAMAADTGDSTDYATREIILLAGELIIRVMPGLESGCIDMEIRN